MHSGVYDGMDFATAVDAIARDLSAKGLGEKTTTWRLRDWGISRQRYWGTPIPIIHCPEHGAVPVPEADLPVVLPEDLVPDGTGNPLEEVRGVPRVHLPGLRQAVERETDTMDTFVDSVLVLHALRVARCAARRWSTRATTTGCRWTSTSAASSTRSCTCCTRASGPRSMRDLGIVKFDEPFTKLFTQGMLTNECYYREETTDAGEAVGRAGSIRPRST